MTENEYDIYVCTPLIRFAFLGKNDIRISSGEVSSKSYESLKKLAQLQTRSGPRLDAKAFILSTGVEVLVQENAKNDIYSKRTNDLSKLEYCTKILLSSAFLALPPAAQSEIYKFETYTIQTNELTLKLGVSSYMFEEVICMLELTEITIPQTIEAFPKCIEAIYKVLSWKSRSRRNTNIYHELLSKASSDLKKKKFFPSPRLLNPNYIEINIHYKRQIGNIIKDENESDANKSAAQEFKKKNVLLQLSSFEPSSPSASESSQTESPSTPTKSSSILTESSLTPTEPSSTPTEPSSTPTEPSSTPTEPSSTPLYDEKNDDGFTLCELIKEALSKIDSNAFLNSHGKSKDGKKILERLWQVELYCALKEHLYEKANISLEVGRMYCDDGIIDLYIPKYGWGIELLIDGVGMKEHYNRFKEDGKYSLIPMKDYIILDIRQTVMAKKLYPKTWYVVPNNNFTILTILEK
ncbi:402_t:CDS:2, partial [Entrophospora sp. SA101]